MNHLDLDRVLELAIAQESAAQEMYRGFAEKLHDPEARETLAFLASEEARHQAFLEAYRRGEVHPGALGGHHAIDAHVVEAFGSPSWDPTWKPQEAFLMAAKQEQVAHEFYQRLALAHPEGEVRDLLMKLAREELAHKEKMEYLYANAAFPQTDGG